MQHSKEERGDMEGKPAWAHVERQDQLLKSIEDLFGTWTDGTRPKHQTSQVEVEERHGLAMPGPLARTRGKPAPVTQICQVIADDHRLPQHERTVHQEGHPPGRRVRKGLGMGLPNGSLDHLQSQLEMRGKGTNPVPVWASLIRDEMQRLHGLPFVRHVLP